ncbi:hypothetical protein [Streptomyces peucetius]|uniref:Sugar phosphate isomerase n=1 Tax=Streptomyces peucetius TaxID=1950 RepID=A0ABY6IGA5_STRPE|nr:hypothetical protein [Streptomyces peucetius]UYQ66018.1 hypothetical protein OGH68_34220 [Streptomyces peucetius]
MHADLSPLIAATTTWLTRAYPAVGGAMATALCEAQARQAVTVAAMLRYPTPMDASLAAMAGPGGSGRLDELGETGHAGSGAPQEHAWRSWVDEVVASWAACLLGSPELAADAVAGLAEGTPGVYRRLVSPDDSDRRAAALLRHPDLLAPVAGLHGDLLRTRLRPALPDVA